MTNPVSERSLTRCPICGVLLKSNGNRGSARKFCSTDHRTAFHSAIRNWAEYAWEYQLISLADLCNPEQSLRALKARLKPRTSKGR